MLLKVPPVILSNVETKGIVVPTTTTSRPPKISFHMDDSNLKQTAKEEHSKISVTQFTDLKQLNENDEEIRRLKKENQFLNRLLETLFPEKISNEDSFTEASSPPSRLETVNNFPSTSILLQYPKEIPTPSSQPMRQKYQLF